jgi:diadenosine tetraphosphate (Ap4A) HIT family hydrolase
MQPSVLYAPADTFEAAMTRTERHGWDSSCRFCEIAGEGGAIRSGDTPISRTEEYFSLASIGALVEGWTLVVPTRHVMSLRADYRRPDFRRFCAQTVSRVEGAYGPVALFEHGANAEGSPTSCGTDHAHLHVVPLAFSLEEIVRSGGFGFTRCKASEIATRAGDAEYLFCSEDTVTDDPDGLLKVLAEPTSQFFRRLIADRIGKPDWADYRLRPAMEVAARTRERLTEAA